MGRRVKCPACGNEFHLHGAGTLPGDEVQECHSCGKMFNPRKQSAIPNGTDHF